MNKKYLLFGILFVAALLRLINLGAGDMTGSDEVFYSFRAVGMLDFDNSPTQPSILQQLDPERPLWSRLSFSDHPPLVFLIQNIFMNIFGENNFGFRFPSAVLGVISVYLVYLLGQRLFSENRGLIAAAIYAVTVNGVYISRMGLQEAYVIFFLLLASYLFLKALERDKYFLWTGAALGLGFLAKYNIFILVPIFLTYIIIFRRDVFKNKKFWLGAVIAALIFSPVIVYNLMLYKNFGHFDFQFSYIFGQNPEIWPVAKGKAEFATVAERAVNFLPNLLATNSWAFLGLLLLSIPYFIRLYIKNPRETFRQKAFLDIALIWLILLIIFFIGPSFRFLTMLTPFLVIKLAFFLDRWKWSYRLALGGLAFFLIFETAYATNSQILNYPAGPQFWLWSKVRFDNYNWGYNELENYLKTELAGQYPALTFDTKYKFLQDIQDIAVDSAKNKGYQAYAAMIIYNPAIHNAAQLWSLDRRQIYHGWPVITAANFASLINEKGPDYLTKAGIRSYYFITPTEAVPWRESFQFGEINAQIEKQLTATGFKPLSLKNKRGEEAFRVYKFSL